MPQCKAKSKRTQQRCKARAMIGFEVCGKHGGKSLVGAANPAFRHGKFSRFIPPGMRKTFEEMRDDPELLSLKDDVALLAVRMSDLLGRLKDGESGELWKHLRETLSEASGRQAELGAAVRSSDGAEFERAYRALSATLNEAHNLINRATQREDTWTEIQGVIEQRSRVASREWARMVDLDAVLTAEQAQTLILAITHSVKRNVTDAKAMSRIASDIALLLSGDRQRKEVPASVEPIRLESATVAVQPLQ